MTAPHVNPRRRYLKKPGTRQEQTSGQCLSWPTAFGSSNTGRSSYATGGNLPRFHPRLGNQSIAPSVGPTPGQSYFSTARMASKAQASPALPSFLANTTSYNNGCETSTARNQYPAVSEYEESKEQHLRDAQLLEDQSGPVTAPSPVATSTRGHSVVPQKRKRTTSYGNRITTDETTSKDRGIRTRTMTETGRRTWMAWTSP